MANNQPATTVIGAIRASLTGAPGVGTDAWHAVVWSLGMILGSVALSGVLFARRGG
ncbi:MAG: hypothetical protein JO325_13275 [Solirubrobacterales bacterium]|nr:hypothetical protein [Solirubrobacterales bacterium]